MADSTTSPIVLSLIDRLQTLEGVSGDETCRKMLQSLMVIKAMAVALETPLQRDSTGEVIKIWLDQIQDACYEADDLLDEVEVYLLKSKVIKVRNLFSVALNLNTWRKTLELRKIETRFGNLVDVSRSFSPLILLNEPEETARTHTSSLIDQSLVCGREKDREYILNWLTEDSVHNSGILSIVGMGGIGKTTLAQLVYNDEHVLSCFDLRAWVFFSENLDTIRLVRSILEAVTGVSDGVSDRISSLDILQKMLVDKLLGKKFLIVLDDVWSEVHYNWFILAECFRAGSRGSRVLITTRNMQVASIAASDCYYLDPLTFDDSWSLFRRIAFAQSSDEGNLFLELQGEILSKCQGLPLALVMLGRLLRFQRTQSEWRSILDSYTWDNPLGESVLSILMLSYNHLPEHLKQCFAFCSVFPDDYLIKKEKLIQYWIANSFVPSSTSGQTMEEIGDGYFRELLSRSFLIAEARDLNGEIVECRMHSLIRDLARYVVRNSAVVESEHQLEMPSKLRHSSVVSASSEPSFIPHQLHQVKNLRTLLLFGKFGNIPSSNQVLKRLRVLDMSQSGIQELPASIGDLIHLRYLDVSGTFLETLPESIHKLNRLKTLNLSKCYKLQKLSNGISELTELRHLDIHSCVLLTHMPFGIGKLRLLQTLPTFILSKIHGMGNLHDLGSLNLRGRLEIKNLEYVSNMADAQSAKLYEKKNLFSLGLYWGQNLDVKMPVKVLEFLEFPDNLRVLDIIGCRETIFPSLMWSHNLFLEKISIINCYCESLPSLGQLPLLRELHLKGLSGVCTIDSGFYGNKITAAFPSLKQLEVYDLPNLWHWKKMNFLKDVNLINQDEASSSVLEQAFPYLVTLSIRGCFRLTEMPFFPSLEELALSKCSNLLLNELGRLTSLSSLVLNEFRQTDSVLINLESLNSLRTLTIYDCDDLLSLVNGMQGLSALENLMIMCCNELNSLPEGLGYLSSLQKLVVIECQELVSIPDIFMNLSSLKEVIVKDCPKLVSFPDSIKCLPGSPNIMPVRKLELDEILSTVEDCS